MTTLVVAGALANKANKGGEAWVRLSWIRGLARLGADVHFIEELDSTTCTDDEGQAAGFEQSMQVGYFREVVREFELDGRAALIVDGEHAIGLGWDDINAVADDSALLVNISGHLRQPGLRDRFRRRAYVDIDPGFTQIWQVSGYHLGLDDHDLHFTIGENIGTPLSSVPSAGFDWIPTRQPVVLDDWPLNASPRADRFTTIATWRGPYGPIEHDGRAYGLKVHQFREYLAVPEHAAEQFEIALDIDPADDADRDALLAHGWKLVDPCEVAADPHRFRSYVQGSDGEFSVAQGVYSEMRTGWFSDRSVRYLASGKPVLVQDTGFGTSIETGEGVVPFASFEDAIRGATSIERDYEAHCETARAIAERYFASHVVLEKFLADAGVRL